MNNNNIDFDINDLRIKEEVPIIAEVISVDY